MSRHYDDDDDGLRPARSRRRDDYDDDEEDRPRRRSQPAGSNQATKIVLIIGVVILGIFMICGGLALYIYISLAKGIDETKTNLQQQAQQDMEKNRQKSKEDEQRRLTGNKVQAEKGMNAFLAELKGNRAETAYTELTTSDYRNRVTLDEFRKMADILAINDSRGATMMKGDFFAADDLKTYAYESFGFGPRIRVTMILKNDQWLVDRLSIAR